MDAYAIGALVSLIVGAIVVGVLIDDEDTMFFDAVLVLIAACLWPLSIAVALVWGVIYGVSWLMKLNL